MLKDYHDITNSPTQSKRQLGVRGLFKKPHCAKPKPTPKVSSLSEIGTLQAIEDTYNNPAHAGLLYHVFEKSGRLIILRLHCGAGKHPKTCSESLYGIKVSAVMGTCCMDNPCATHGCTELECKCGSLAAIQVVPGHTQAWTSGPIKIKQPVLSHVLSTLRLLMSPFSKIGANLMHTAK